MPAIITKTTENAEPNTPLTGKKTGAQEILVDFKKSSIVRKTVSMSETMKKHPRPLK